MSRLQPSPCLQTRWRGSPPSALLMLVRGNGIRDAATRETGTMVWEHRPDAPFIKAGSGYGILVALAASPYQHVWSSNSRWHAALVSKTSLSTARKVERPPIRVSLAQTL